MRVTGARARMGAMRAQLLVFAESFPDYVSDHTGYFVGALVVAILLLLLVVRISQRRAKEKAEKADPGTVVTPPAPASAPPPPAGTGSQGTTEMPAVPTPA